MFERVFIVSVFFDFFIYSKSTKGAAEGVSVPLPLGVNDPLGRSIGTGATICNRGKIIVPWDPMISTEMKERSKYLILFNWLERIIHDPGIFGFIHIQ